MRKGRTPDRTDGPHSRWERLTHTGGGTAMGDLLRRYWWPVAFSEAPARIRSAATAEKPIRMANVARPELITPCEFNPNEPPGGLS